MSNLAISSGKPPLQTQLLTWLPIIIGLAVLYVPSLYDLFTGIWSSDEQMHGPIVLGIKLFVPFKSGRFKLAQI